MLIELDNARAYQFISDYLTDALGRLATVNQRGEPQVAAVGFHYNPEFDTIDIVGYDMANSQKFRNIARNGLVSFLVDACVTPVEDA